MRQSAKRRVLNDNRRRAMKEAVKGIKKAVTTGAKTASTDLAKAYQAIDKAVKRGVLKKNAGARKKSRLVAFIKRGS